VKGGTLHESKEGGKVGGEKTDLGSRTPRAENSQGLLKNSKGGVAKKQGRPPSTPAKQQKKEVLCQLSRKTLERRGRKT